MMDIQKTTNYKKFKKIRGNRKINKTYLTKLAQSIREKNMLPQNPIMVNDKMQILDGQHRLKVAEMINIPIYYVVISSGNLSDVQMLNTNVRGWTVSDFLESYIALGKKDYKDLLDFAESNDLSISNSMYILAGGFQNNTVKSRLIRAFRDGNFKVTHKSYAKEFAKRLGDISKFTEDNVWKDREFMKALEKAYYVVKHDALMDNLQRSGTKFRRRVTIKDYIRDIEDVISYKKRSIKRIET